MTFLSKLLPHFIYPLGFALILVTSALFLAKRKRLQRVALIGAILILWLASTRWVSFGLARSLEWRHLPPDRIQPIQAIVVLGGGTEPQQYPRSTVEINSAGDRLLLAAHLYRQGAAPVLLLSGGGIDWMSSGSQPASEMASFLELLGVPPGDMLLESESINTHQNAVNTRIMLDAIGITDILLITSASHMPRAVSVFRAQGFQVTPMPTDYVVTEEGWNQLVRGGLYTQIMNLVPSAGNLSLTSRILKEYLGMVYYSLIG